MKHTQQTYRERISLVVAAILKEPTADHRLEDLAAIAHFSPFHFHRIYRDVTGETVAATIRRVRLARATQLLGQANVSVAQVSTMVGYESPQAFTRAFRAFAGRSPSEFRQRARTPVGKPSVERSPATDGAQQQEIQIVYRRALSVLGMPHSGPFSTIAHTHQRLRRALEGRTASSWLGVSYGHRAQPMQGLNYYAAAATQGSIPADSDLQTLEIAAGTYAVHTLSGPYTQINAVLKALYMRWLPHSGYEADDRPIVEHYLNSPRTTAPDALLTDLLIPIRELP